MIKREDIQIRDPFVLPFENEQKYYLFGSTDKNTWEGKATGFDAYTSADLESWEGPFPVFRPMQGFWADQNFWAPEVHKYKGKYYMFASFKAEGLCRGTQILVADHPKGPFIPWSNGPLTPRDWECLDGTLFIDEYSEPWMVFCHEWLQVYDGEMCAIRLAGDLRTAIGEPVILFRASEAPWSTLYRFSTIVENNSKNGYITDGPFLYRTSNGQLLMLWSSFGEEGYAIGMSRSETGSVMGPWVHEEEPLFKKDGGHGMIFKTFDGLLMLAIHTPNITPDERAVFFELKEADGKVVVFS